METKSRYEVISDLEKQKRELIRERDELTDASRAKERKVLNLERAKEDILKQKMDFDMKRDIEMQNVERQKVEFDFKIKNTEEDVDRQIEDARKDLEDYNESIEQKKETAEELIKGVNESLERFGKLQSK